MTAIISGSCVDRIKTIHDLRNMFGIVASGSRLLETPQDAATTLRIREAMRDAARRGAALASMLLASAVQKKEVVVDVAARLRGLEPLLTTQIEGARLALEVPAEPIRIRIAPDDFDSAVLELVANAKRARSMNGIIRIRAHRVGARLWLLVADTGHGMHRAAVDADRNGHSLASTHGHGLAFVRAFARQAHGAMHIRSQPGLGTVVALNLPLVLSMAVAKAAAPQRKSPDNVETNDGHRQQLAA